jgi:hypothetical protein
MEKESYDWCVIHQSDNCRCIQVARMTVLEREKLHLFEMKLAVILKEKEAA